MLTFSICLAVGIGIVAWRANAGAHAARAQARAHALAFGKALELESARALSAIEVLGALARQNAGAFPDFQKTATDLLSTRPGLATLELQPGGVVREIAPRAGSERVLGFNVLSDPVYGPGSHAAIENRVLTLAGPVRVYGNGPGIAAWLPVFQHSREGREFCWGLVAGSLRFSDLLGRARLNDLDRAGYDYLLFAPGSASQKPIVIASHGYRPLTGTVQQSLQVRNLEFRLVLRPSGGWIDPAGLLAGGLAALCVAVLAGLLVNLRSGGASQPALAEVSQKLAREQAERIRTQGELAAAKKETAAKAAELERASAALRQAEARASQSKAHETEILRKSEESGKVAEHKIKTAEARAADLDARLDAGARAVQETTQAQQAELDRSQAALHDALEKIQKLETRLESAAAAEEKVAAANALVEENQKAIEDLKSRVESTRRAARKAGEAYKAQLRRAEEETRQLEDRAARAGKAEARVQELTRQLEEAQAEVHRLRAAAPAGPAPAEPGPAPTVSAPAKSEHAKKQSSEPPAVKPSPAPVSDAAEESASKSPPPRGGRKKARRDNQMDLFGGNQEPESTESPRPEVQARTKEPPAEEPEAPPAGPLSLPEFRKAVNEILPLLVDRDPGAKDCLAANRDAFRSAFSPEAYKEFARQVKAADFDAALEQLRKAAKKHGIPA